MSRRTELEILNDVLWNPSYVERYAERDLSDSMAIDAISMRLSAGLEALSRLPMEAQMEMFGEAARKVRGMRNRIAHAYRSIDPQLVKDTVRGEVPGVMDAVRERTGRLADDG